MNKNKLKVYAPRAREEFIKVVSERAALYGITEKKIEPCEIKGDYAFISGKPFSKSIEKSRDELIERIEFEGFTQVVEEVAYTWFNRFAAIRFMELNGYLTHGYRVLNHPQGHSEPEILEKAHYLEKLDGLEKREIISLKTAGNKDAELYRKLIIAQCNELHGAMPFLFEKVNDLTELLLPDNLLNTDSIIRQMLEAIPEEDWKEVEIIGWLYQFYISEKKDALMKAKKAYKTEDIPAVTQLFTPNWIVKYLVQNSLGAKWLGTYPASGIKEKMEYYIEPAEQSDEVKQKIKEITPDSLNPEELTVMDPACGSGHILVEAYNLLKEIYLERGYRPKDISSLILAKNLYGLEIDARASQLAGFALMMKARQDDRQIFEKHIEPNIVVLKSVNNRVQGRKESKDINLLIDLFEDASTFGSLIRVPEELILKLPSIKQELEHKRGDLNSHDVFTGAQYYKDLLGLARQAEMLSRRYDCVVANPPYMGSKGMNGKLKEFAKTQYPSTKSDLFAMFIERGFEMVKDKSGFNAMVTMQSWMFLSSYEKMREKMFNITTIRNMVHMSNGVMGIAFGTSATIWINEKLLKYRGSFSYVDYSDLIDGNIPREFPIRNNRLKDASTDDFKKIPGSPIAYWVSDRVREIFEIEKIVAHYAIAKHGMSTSDNEKYLRLWYEVAQLNVGFHFSNRKAASVSRRKWFPYNKGGSFRRWYGNNEYLVNWQFGGEEIRKVSNEKYPYLKGNLGFVLGGQEYFFRKGITWSSLSSGKISMRAFDEGFLFDAKGQCLFPKSEEMYDNLMAFLNTKIVDKFLTILSPTLDFNSGKIAVLPVVFSGKEVINPEIKKIVSFAKSDWDSFETSWDFAGLPILRTENKNSALDESYQNYRNQCNKTTAQIKQLEEENNRIFIEAYGLQDELTSEVPIEEITLFANPKYRYGGNLSDKQLEARFKADTMKELISHSIGCMMGRYSLDKPGLIYAHSGNEGFDATQYKTLPADNDGIVPITEREWFDDDAACRFFRFIETAWDKKGLDGNLDFIADAIGRKSGESSRETIRRYFVNDFYKGHCQTYKKRPIYWLFASGKEKAFQALVYLHRYNESTLSRMRTEYVLPLQTKIARHIEHLEKDKDNTTSTSAANKVQKEIASLLKQRDELIKFDEHLRHYADMKIKLDLDDGVKVNYNKFGELLADVKKIAGVKEEKDESAD